MPKKPQASHTRALRPYALRFISGKYQGGEFPLPAEGEFVIGRSSELDVVLVEDMVSRRHAKVTVTGDHLHIQDLGSTNGTFVNGEKVKRVRLNEGDRILIGTSIVKLVASEGSAPAVRPPSLEDVAARRTSNVRTMTGSVKEIPIPDLLQLFSASRKSGMLVIRTDRDTGKIFLKNGAVVFAVVNENYDVAPLKSVIRILMWPDGTFDMDAPQDREFKNPLEMATEGLLIESLRQIDELRNLGPDLPRLGAHVALAMPIEPPLRDLGPDDLEVLQLVVNHGTVEAVLNASEKDDVVSAEILMKLIRKGYVRVAPDEL